MMKEHKKLYKSGKNWVTATLVATTLAVGGVAYSTNNATVYADSGEAAAPATQGVNDDNDPRVKEVDGVDLNAGKRNELKTQLQSAQNDVDAKKQAYNNVSDDYAQASADVDSAQNQQAAWAQEKATEERKQQSASAQMKLIAGQPYVRSNYVNAGVASKKQQESDYQQQIRATSDRIKQAREKKIGSASSMESS